MTNSSLGALVAIGVLVLVLNYGKGTPADRPVPKGAMPISDVMTLVVVESDSCGWCTRFREDAAPVYEASALVNRAPLAYLDIADQRNSKYTFAGSIYSTPTFVLVDTYGREIKRYKGYPGGGEQFLQVAESLIGRRGL